MYRYCDLILDSALPLPELPRADGGDPATADCRFLIEPGSVPRDLPARWEHAWHEPDGRISLRWTRHDGWYWLDSPGAATFAIASDGGAIHGWPAPGAPEATVRHLLLDQVLPRLLARSGRWILHAGAVLTPAGVCGFLGPSGAGKSTLCAALAARGHALLGDDGLALSSDSGRLEARPTYRSMRLPRASLGRLTAPDQARAWRRHPTRKMQLDPARCGPVPPGSLPVARLYLLDAARERPVSIEALSPRDGFIALLRNSFQLDLAGRHQARRLFRQAAEQALALPLRRLAYARSYELLPAVCDAVLADVDPAYSPKRSAG